MPNIKEILLYIYMACIACASLYFATKLAKAPLKPNCHLTEISPDFSDEQRAWCRKQRHKL